jgi:hypothetical protein
VKDEGKNDLEITRMGAEQKQPESIRENQPKSRMDWRRYPWPAVFTILAFDIGVYLGRLLPDNLAFIFVN